MCENRSFIKQIVIETGYADVCIEKFKKTFLLYATKEEVRFARVFYDTNEDKTVVKNPLMYPLTIRTKDFIFCLKDVSAGYKGNGPKATIDVLRWLGLAVEEKEIYQERQNGITSLKFNKVA